MPLLPTLQLIFTSGIVSVLLIGAVGLFMPYEELIPAPGLGVVFVLIAVAAVAVLSWVSSRPLRGDTPEALRSAYLMRSLMKLVLCEAPAIAGFVLAMLGGPRWMVWLGAVFSLGQLATAFPLPSRLARHDQQLRMAGNPVTLSEVVQGAGASPPEAAPPD
jgi:hypothetical protein